MMFIKFPLPWKHDLYITRSEALHALSAQVFISWNSILTLQEGKRAVFRLHPHPIIIDGVYISHLHIIYKEAK